ncbi:MAG: hypothetical protein BWY09_02924 [Candidatus Hydrogenedentes bacterium ADurb.Bin179]|nr:MAG: hypothetical protein BWY09_02924 [Candidatus Hydrogenedentes bacterium ADurb.Bin179]
MGAVSEAVGTEDVENFRCGSLEFFEGREGDCGIVRSAAHQQQGMIIRLQCAYVAHERGQLGQIGVRYNRIDFQGETGNLTEQCQCLQCILVGSGAADGVVNEFKSVYGNGQSEAAFKQCRKISGRVPDGIRVLPVCGYGDITVREEAADVDEAGMQERFAATDVEPPHLTEAAGNVARFLDMHIPAAFPDKAGLAAQGATLCDMKDHMAQIPLKQV